MSERGEDRLLRAMRVWLHFKQDEDPPTQEELLAQHDDLADLLATMMSDASEDDGDEADDDADEEDEGAPSLRPGRRVGEYALQRPLGSGGMGVVWEARQTSLGRPVALKILLGLGHLDPRRLARFRREAEAGSRVNHQGIVAVHAVGEADGLAYIAQELVADGRSLADWIQETRLDPGEGSARERHRWVAGFFAHVADAMQAAHDASVVHRDLKPGNLLVTAAGLPKVADFGLAWVHSEPSVSRSGDVVGTPYYMSPEQIHGDGRVDGRSDVFSLGSTLYEALTGARAFEAPSGPAVFRRIEDDDPAPPRGLDPTIPPDLAAVCSQALAKDPADRYATMAELAADLRRFLDQRPVLARRPGPALRARRWVRRHPGLVAGIFVALTAVGLAVGSSLDAATMRVGELRHLERSSRLYREQLLSPVVLKSNAAFEALAREVQSYVNEDLAQVPHLQLAVLRDLAWAALGRDRGSTDLELGTSALRHVANVLAEPETADIEARAIAVLDVARALREAGRAHEAAEHLELLREELVESRGERDPLARALTAEIVQLRWTLGHLPGAHTEPRVREAAAQLTTSLVSVPTTQPARRRATLVLADISMTLGEWDRAAEHYASWLSNAPGDDSDPARELTLGLAVRSAHAVAATRHGDIDQARVLLMSTRADREALFGTDALGQHVDATRLAAVDYRSGRLLGLAQTLQSACAVLDAAERRTALATLEARELIATVYLHMAEGSDSEDAHYFREGAQQALDSAWKGRSSAHGTQHPWSLHTLDRLRNLGSR